MSLSRAGGHIGSLLTLRYRLSGNTEKPIQHLVHHRTLWLLLLYLHLFGLDDSTNHLYALAHRRIQACDVSQALISILALLYVLKFIRFRWRYSIDTWLIGLEVIYVILRIFFHKNKAPPPTISYNAVNWVVRKPLSLIILCSLCYCSISKHNFNVISGADFKKSFYLLAKASLSSGDSSVGT